MITRTFDQWDADDLSRVFGLARARHSPTFDAWLSASAPYSFSDAEQESLELLRDELADAVDLWNEDELKFRFIAPLIHLVRYNTQYTSVFTQRALAAVVNDIELRAAE
jgi:hypothetical protein